MKNPPSSDQESTQICGARFTIPLSDKASEWRESNAGYLVHLEAGSFELITENKRAFISSGTTYFLPKGTRYRVRATEAQAFGRFVFIPRDSTISLPEKFTIYEATNLFLEISRKISTWGILHELDPAQRRLSQVFIDELLQQPQANYLLVPLPTSPALVLVAKQILANPNDMNTIDHWANAAAMSRRSFTKFFKNETGLTFMNWRHQVKMAEAIKLLKDEKTNHEVAYALGYKNASTFIAVFRKMTGVPPSLFLKAEAALKVPAYIFALIEIFFIM